MLDHQQAMGLRGVLPSGANAEEQLYTTYLASSVRSLAFGLHEAHAQGMAVQVNHLVDRGAIIENADGTLGLDLVRMKTAVRDLAHELLMLEATGDYAATKKLMSERAVLRPAFSRLLQATATIPIDIRPIFVTADALAPAAASK
jgi:hypothetical protein